MLDRQVGQPYDLLARYGGDEFLLLLPDTGAEGAAAVAERIHASLDQVNVENRASPIQGKLTVSIGIGVAAVSPAVDPARLLDITAAAFYKARRLGRNRTCIQES